MNSTLSMGAYVDDSQPKGNLRRATGGTSMWAPAAMFLSVSLSSPVLAEDLAKVCIHSASEAHNQARLQLYESAGPVMTPDAQITRRRLDEKYCLEMTACSMQGQSNATKAFNASAYFSSCLKKAGRIADRLRVGRTTP
jgi:hypothetical protein